MFMGHFATALVPLAKLDKAERKSFFWILLLASQFLDFIMLIFVALGMESMTPGKYGEAPLYRMQTEMVFSHDIVPVLAWIALFGGIVYAVKKNTYIAIWSAILVAVHELFDLIVGFEHNIFGKDTMAVGTNLYHKNPALGLFIEAVICSVCIIYFVKVSEKRNLSVSKSLKIFLWVCLVGMTLLSLPAGYTPAELKEILGF